MPWVTILEMLLVALAGGKISTPVHVADSSGAVDVVVSYDPKNGHIDFQPTVSTQK